jgi:hypothetical protein
MIGTILIVLLVLFFLWVHSRDGITAAPGVTFRAAEWVYCLSS